MGFWITALSPNGEGSRWREWPIAGVKMIKGLRHDSIVLLGPHLGEIDVAHGQGNQIFETGINAARADWRAARTRQQ